MTRSTVTAVVVGLLAAGALAVGTRAQAPQDKQAAKAEERLKELLQERLEAAQTETEARQQEYLAGRSTADIMCHASERLLRATLEMAKNKADRVTAYENHAERMKDVYKFSKAQFDAGRKPVAELSQVLFFYRDAEIQLHREKAR